MAHRTTAYVYGNTARSLEAEPIRRREEERRIRQREQAKPKRRVDKVALTLTLVTFLFTMLVSFTYLQKQFQATYLSKSVVSLESQVVELEKSNRAENERIDDSINLSQIYTKATKDMGMILAKKNQVYTYESKRSTQIRQHGNIPEE